MFDVLTAGRNHAGLRALEEMLKGHSGIATRRRELGGDDLDPLRNSEPLPDLLVLLLDSQSRGELEALDQRAPEERPVIFVVGPKGDPELIRLTMRAGARDFFFDPPVRDELLDAIDRAIEEKERRSTVLKRRVGVIINAKGGAGASFIATNVAHILAAHFKSKTALLDMDLQFGFLSSNFSITANDGLHQAMESIDTLDGVALEGWSAKHASGVSVFGNTHRQLLLSRDFSEEQIGKFLELALRTYNHVIIDVPRQIDHLFASCVQRTDTVMVVLQQSVAHLRDARTLMKILQRELMLRDDQIIILVNRWSKNALVSTKDIEKALPGLQLMTVPNDYQSVAESLNTGVPVYELRPKAAITRDLVKLASLVGSVSATKKGFLQRLFGSTGR
jgi:pilus assembly protein CpaE